MSARGASGLGLGREDEVKGKEFVRVAEGNPQWGPASFFVVLS